MSAFKVSREKLATELSILSACAERKTTIPVLSYVLVETLIGRVKLTATDLDTSITTELEIENLGDPKAFCLPASRLTALVQLFDGDTVTITPELNDWVTVECGESKQKLPSIKPADFPSLPNVEGVTIDATEIPLAEMLAAVQFGMSREVNDKAEYWTAELSLADEILSLTTTNGFVVAHAECVAKGAAFSVLLPKRSIAIYRKFIEGATKATLTISENNLAVKTNARSFTSRLAVDKFPSWRSFIPTNEKIVELPEGLNAALKRACLSTDYNGYVKHSFGDGKLTLTAKGHEEGEASEVLSCPSVNGDSFDIGINARHLQEVLRETGEAIVEFKDDKTQFLVRPKEKRAYDLYYVLMPVRLDRIFA